MFRRMLSPRRTEARRDYWIAGQFGRASHAEAERAIATWSELLGRQSAELWLAAQSEGRGR